MTEDNPTTPKPAEQESPVFSDGQVSPDDLMGDFKGKSMFNVLVLVLVLHVLVIGGFSYSYFKTQVFGETETAELTDEERMNLAVREATAAVREIAEKHKINKQELANRFGESATGSARTSSDGDTPAEGPAQGDPPDGPETPEGELSDIERAVTVEQPGPDVPGLDDDITEEEPIFPE